MVVTPCQARVKLCQDIMKLEKGFQSENWWLTGAAGCRRCTNMVGERRCRKVAVSGSGRCSVHGGIQEAHRRHGRPLPAAMVAGRLAKRLATRLVHQAGAAWLYDVEAFRRAPGHRKLGIAEAAVRAAEERDPGILVRAMEVLGWTETG
jgi:hypothetical protein